MSLRIAHRGQDTCWDHRQGKINDVHDEQQAREKRVVRYGSNSRRCSISHARKVHGSCITARGSAVIPEPSQTHAPSRRRMVENDLLLPTEVTSTLCPMREDQYVACQVTHKTMASAAMIQLRLTIVTSHAQKGSACG